MSAIFALANQKGGVAKTTTTGILAAGLKKQGFSVLTIDCDPQGNLSMSVAAENQDSATMYEVMKGTVSAREAIQHTPSCDIIPANTILAGIEQELHNVGKEMTLREKLRDEQTGVAEAYDYILIDAPPTLGGWVMNILCASDYVLVPVEASPWGMFGLANMFDFLNEVREIAPALQVLGIVVTKADARKNYFKQTMETLKEMEGIYLFESFIRVDSSIEWSQDSSEPVVEFKKSSRSAKEYIALAEEVMDRVSR